MSESRKYALILGLLFTLFVLVEYFTPKPINWEETFTNKDKIPYGTFVLYEFLPDIFPDQTISSVRLPIANQLDGGYSDPENYIFINREFNADTLDMEALTNYVARGNNVFIAAEDFGYMAEKALKFKTRPTTYHKTDSVALTFTSPGIKTNKTYNFHGQHAQYFIQPENDSAAFITLAKNPAGEPVFIKKPVGEGAFYISSTPYIFCNYITILPQQFKYAATALSHLPVNPVIWDEYQKQGRIEDRSVFRVLMRSEPLSWAYYLALGGIVLFIIFEGKRTQRIIPTWETPRNTTLDFVKVVGNLYYNHRNHRVIAEKKINYFFEYLRLHYFEHSLVPDPEFNARIAAKSGLAETRVEKLMALIQEIRKAENITEKQLTLLNTYLEEFYRQAGK